MSSAQQRLDIAMRFFTPAMRDIYDAIVADLPPDPPPTRCRFSATCEADRARLEAEHAHDTTTQPKGEVW